MWGKSLGSFFSACGSPTLWRDYPLLVLDTLLRGQLTSDAWVYFRAPLLLSTGLSAFMPFPYCLAYYSFEYILKSESVIMPSAFFLMFKITLANFFLCVWFPMNLRISCFCKKKCHWCFCKDHIKSGVGFRYSKNILPVHEHEVSFHLPTSSLVSFISVTSCSVYSRSTLHWRITTSVPYHSISLIMIYLLHLTSLLISNSLKPRGN